MQQALNELREEVELCIEKLNESISLSVHNMKKTQMMLSEFKGVVGCLGFT